MGVHVVSITQFQRILVQMTPKIRDACIRGLRSGALILHRTVVIEIGQSTPYPAVDTGELRNSVDTEFTDQGAIVDVKAPHAAVMEHGARPFRPPLAPLIEWVKRKGLARGSLGTKPRGTSREVWRSREEAEAVRIARAVQRKIAKDGIAPRHYFAKAVVRANPMIRAEVDLELARLGYGTVRGGGRSRGTVVGGNGEGGNR